jgi:hypothetical protein
MRDLLVLLIAGCYVAPVTPPPAPVASPAPPRTSAARTRAARISPNRTVARITPPELAGALLGMSAEDLKRARPAIALDPSENYEFREHYIETVDDLAVHYYTLRDGGAMYQISIDFPDEATAAAMWDRYASYGAVIDDLGGKEIVIEGAPWQVRVWTHDARLQIMAVIEGSEWWSQYHPGGSADGDGDGGNVVP